MLKKIIRGWDYVEERVIGNVACAGLFLATTIALVEVFRRYIFDVCFPWQEDVVIYTILMSTYLYFGITLKQGAHLRVTLFMRLFGSKVEKVLGVITSSIGIVYCLIFVWFGSLLVKMTFEFGRLTEGAYLPFYVFYAILTIGFLLVGIRYAEHIYLQIKGRLSATSSGHGESKE